MITRNVIMNCDYRRKEMATEITSIMVIAERSYNIENAVV